MNKTNLTQQTIDDVFAILKGILKSHYPTPRLDYILGHLNQAKPFEFRAGPPHIWEAVFTIKEKDEMIEFSFTPLIHNQSPLIKNTVEKYKQEFDKKLQEYLRTTQ